MNRKGFTLIELLVTLAIIGIFVYAVGGIILVGVSAVTGITAADDAIETAKVEKEKRLVINPPLYAVGDIVYHKASHKRMIVTKRYTSWNDEKGGWNIKVKDGGNYDAVGGFIINETEVILTLKEVGR